MGLNFQETKKKALEYSLNPCGRKAIGMIYIDFVQFKKH